MKKFAKVLIIPLLASAISSSGCTKERNIPSTNTPVISENANKIPSKNEIFDLLSQAGEINYQFSAKNTYSSEEVYAHYNSHFTRRYVDHVVLQGGNWKKEGNQWVLAVDGGEYIEGTYFHTDFNKDAEIVVAEDKKKITVTNPIGDGLYAPHKEIITLLNTENGWKVDHLKWEALQPQINKPPKVPDSKQPPNQNHQDPVLTSPKIVAENEAFRIFQPVPDTVVDKTFIVRGEARVFEAVLSYTFEDGHNVLAKGHVQASEGAPEWGSFEIKITIDQASSPTGVLSIYEESAKDGSPRNILNIPVKFKEELIKQ